MHYLPASDIIAYIVWSLVLLSSGSETRVGCCLLNVLVIRYCLLRLWLDVLRPVMKFDLGLLGISSKVLLIELRSWT